PSTVSSLVPLLLHPYTYTLSLHDALPISVNDTVHTRPQRRGQTQRTRLTRGDQHTTVQPEITELLAGTADRDDLGVCRGIRCHRDRKSTRLNSSHVSISYAVFCLKKKTFI